MSTIYGSWWGEILKLLGPMLLELADSISDPPDEYEDLRTHREDLKCCPRVRVAWDRAV